MKVTRQIVADKIADYLHGKVSQAELVDWAEGMMMDADFDKADTDLLTDIVGRLGLDLVSRTSPNSGCAGKTVKNSSAASAIGRK